MTEFATRAPLQTLSMSSSQRGPPSRRRSARLAFEEEEEEEEEDPHHREGSAEAPPPKRAKVAEDAHGIETASEHSGKQGKTTAAAAAKGKSASYEDIDGFKFTRAGKPKKAAANKAKPASPPKSKAAEKNNEPLATRPTQQSKQEEAAQQPPRRRSARLSGEKASDQAADQAQAAHQHAPQANGDVQTTQAQTKEDEAQPAQERGRTQTPTAKEIHVEKKRAATKIALPFADTPVMARNKAMRKSSAESRRRSSSQMRGRRASSLIDSGASNALPHNQVEVSDFYKHINQEQYEPRRMKQLLVWCGTRALPERPTGPLEDVNAALAARVVQEEILQDFSNKAEMSDWFDRDDVAPTALVKRPNPRNVQNAAKLQELEREVERLKQEQASWNSIIKNLASSIAKEGEQVTAEASSSVNSKQLSAQDQASFEELETSKQSLSRHKERLEAVTKPLEFKLDHFAEQIHKLERFTATVDKQVDGILSDSAQALDERDKAAASSAGTRNVGARELLRSLSRAA